jgi:histidine ammonia-lyase
MGLFRKLTSVSTLGAVDFKSDKERTASYTKATRNEARKQTKMMKNDRKPAPASVGELRSEWSKMKLALKDL